MTVPWIPFFPDANEPVVEVLGYPTSILTSGNGREQRIRLREYPTREFTMRMVEMDARQSVRLLYALEQGYDFNCHVPFWPEVFQTTTPHVATDSVLNVDRTTERIQWSGEYAQALVWRGEGNVARYSITADALGTIGISPPLAENWPVGTYIVPLWPCKITGVGKVDRATDDAVILESLTARLDWDLDRRSAALVPWYLRNISSVASLAAMPEAPITKISKWYTAGPYSPLPVIFEWSGGPSGSHAPLTTIFQLNKTIKTASGSGARLIGDATPASQFAGSIGRWSTPSLQAQMVSRFSALLSMRHSRGVLGEHYVSAWLTQWRPGTGVIAQYGSFLSSVQTTYNAGVFSTYNHGTPLPIDVSDELDIQLNDRIVLEVHLTTVEVTPAYQSVFYWDGIDREPVGPGLPFEMAARIEMPDFLFVPGTE